MGTRHPPGGLTFRGIMALIPGLSGETWGTRRGAFGSVVRLPGLKGETWGTHVCVVMQIWGALAGVAMA